MWPFEETVTLQIQYSPKYVISALGHLAYYGSPGG